MMLCIAFLFNKEAGAKRIAQAPRQSRHHRPWKIWAAAVSYMKCGRHPQKNSKGFSSKI
jgi:hypothetical protein